MKNKKAFTLIELVAVLVILAILALIVTPIVMNIISKAKDSANKRSIDAYGRSIELAIASHLIETGNFPTSIEELTIEYNGDEVVCETTQLNSDSSVYLAGCTVGGKRVEGYTYGKGENVTYDAYEVGDEVTYNNVDYYVIKDSSSSEEDVTLLKAEPLIYDEMISLLASTEVYDKATRKGIYLTMPYYSSDTCTSVSATANCNTDYNLSNVKQVLDVWTNSKLKASDLSSDKTRYSVRLITYDEFENLGFIEGNVTPSDIGLVATENTPSWVFENYDYWIMTPYKDSTHEMWSIYNGSMMGKEVGNYCSGSVVGEQCIQSVGIRPVITLKKSALQ